MKATGESTQDAYSLFEYAVPGGVNGPPPHVHTREDESFICLAGRLEVMLGGETFVLGTATTCSCRATSCTPSATRSTTRRA